jgi:hypothetical protein
VSRIIDFARLQVGKPYVFGKSGPDSFDCSGLTKRAAAQIGLDWYHGATTQWLRGKSEGVSHQYAYFGESGPIQDLPMDKVAFLFNQDKTKTSLVMAHTGIYDGAGRVIQAGGYGGKGVHDNPIDKRRWSHYAILTPFWAQKDEDDYMDTTLKQGSIGEAVKQLQLGLIALGYDVGKNTQADGKFGPATAAGVRKFQADEGLPVTGFWTPEDQNALDNALADENGPPVNDDAPPVDEAALLTELEGLNRRLAVIIAALKGVL